VAEALCEAIDDVDACLDGASVTALLAAKDRLDAYVADVVGRFELDGGWAIDGAPNLVAWLRHAAGRSGGAAARLSVTAKRMRSLTKVADAWADGTLSSAHVDAVVSNVPQRHVDRFRQHEADNVEMLSTLRTHEAGVAMRNWRIAADDENPKPESKDPERALFLSETMSGRGELRGHLDPDGREVVQTALRLADANEFDRPAAERRADALVDICRFFLDNRDHPSSSRHRPHVNLVLDVGSGEATTVDGERVAESTLREYLCDAVVRRVMTAGSIILDYGQGTYTVPAGLWNAVVLRDRCCRFGGCNRPGSWCQAHHVTKFPDGPTALGNLVLLCSLHHRMVHREGWHLELEPDGTLHLTDPTGRTHTTRPPGPYPPRLL
jgi:hypothetical protein